MSPLDDKKELEEELDRLAKMGGGILTANSVVEAARSPDNPMHRYFEWDDAVAAEAYRLDQARVLIRSVRMSVMYEETPLSVPRYVHSDLEDGDAGYRALFAIQNDEQKQRVISGEMQTGMAHLRRAGSIALAIDNTRLHNALSREVDRIGKYLETLIRRPSEKPELV